MVSREFGSENHTTYCWQMLYYKILFLGIKSFPEHKSIIATILRSHQDKLQKLLKGQLYK